MASTVLLALALVLPFVLVGDRQTATTTSAGDGRPTRVSAVPQELGATGALPEADEPGPELLSGNPHPGPPETGAGSAVDVPEGPLGIPGPLLAAYQRAAQRMGRTDPACGLHWSLLAAIGRVESGHANSGKVDADGTTVTPILGPRLSGGAKFAAIPDTDSGAYDGDPVWDRAVGPMQFIPSTWARYATDGNGDGVASPHNIHDATLAAAHYLCAGTGDLRQHDDLVSAVFRYNHSREYVRKVLTWARAYRTGVHPTPVPELPEVDDTDVLAGRRLPEAEPPVVPHSATGVPGSDADHRSKPPVPGGGAADPEPIPPKPVPDGSESDGPRTESLDSQPQRSKESKRDEPKAGEQESKEREPGEQQEPKKPGEQQDQGDPQEPQEPGEPKEPGKPSPGEPTGPESPQDPESPENPRPENPKEPGPGKPEDPKPEGPESPKDPEPGSPEPEDPESPKDPEPENPDSDKPGKPGSDESGRDNPDSDDSAPDGPDSGDSGDSEPGEPEDRETDTPGPGNSDSKDPETPESEKPQPEPTEPTEPTGPTGPTGPSSGEQVPPTTRPTSVPTTDPERTGQGGSASAGAPPGGEPVPPCEPATLLAGEFLFEKPAVQAMRNLVEGTSNPEGIRPGLIVHVEIAALRPDAGSQPKTGSRPEFELREEVPGPLTACSVPPDFPRK